MVGNIIIGIKYFEKYTNERGKFMTKRIGKRLLAFMLTMVMTTAFVPIMPAMAETSINIGDYVQMGTYYGEPILWRCVDIDSNGPLMLSDKIICLKPFDAGTSANSATNSHGRNTSRSSWGSNYWADSNIRSWLNSSSSAGNVKWLCGNPPIESEVRDGYNDYADEAGFLTNFMSGELLAIKEVKQKSLLSYPEIDARMEITGTSPHAYVRDYPSEALQNYDTAYTEYVIDKIFLLDVKQINEVYNNSDILGSDYYIGKLTSQSVENSEYKDSSLIDGEKWYCWLRSPNSSYSYAIRCVGSYGDIGYGYGYDSYCGVRPAFYLNEAMFASQSGNGSAENPYIARKFYDSLKNDTVTNKYYGAEKFEDTEESKVYDLMNKFNEACSEYLSALKSETEKRSANKTDIEILAEDLRASDENHETAYLTFVGNVPEKVKVAGYQALADRLNNYIEKGKSMGKIDLDDESIDAKLTKEILSKLYSYIKYEKYNGCTVNINLIGYGFNKNETAEMGQFTIKYAGQTYNAMMVSDIKQITAAMNVMLESLRTLGDDLTKEMYRALLTDLADVTGFSDWTKDSIEATLKDVTKTLRKNGFGDVLKFAKECSDGYGIIKRIVSIKKPTIENVKYQLSNAQGLYDDIKKLDYSDSAVDNFVIKQAISKVESARQALEDGLHKYIYNTTGDAPKNVFDKAIDWIENGVTSLFNIKIQCPVDFEVYDKEGKLLGYVKDGEVYCTNDIYIETNGDVKTLCIPEGLEVDIKMIGTDEGEFNYVVEEIIDGEPMGRLNYYSIPLTVGAEFTQSINVETLPQNVDELPIISAEGNISADEYLSADAEDAFVTVDTESGDFGAVIGAGNYAKGDNVELTAIASDDRYCFKGWFVDNELVSTDGIYRFTAIENVVVRAEFIRSYCFDESYHITMSEDYAETLNVLVYKNTDNTNGIVVNPFEEVNGSLTLYYTSYDEDENVIIENLEYTSKLGEDYRYDFAEIDITNVSMFSLADVNGNIVANISKDIIDNDVRINLGDYVQMGTYYDAPILWRCVAFEKISGYDDNGNPIMDSTDTVTEYTEGYLPLMLADKIICLKPFDAKTSSNNQTGSHSRDEKNERNQSGSNYWGDSNIRSWLNSDAPAGEVVWLCGNPPTDENVSDNGESETNGIDDYADEQGFLTNFSDSELDAIKSVTQKSFSPQNESDDVVYTMGTEIYSVIGNLYDFTHNYDSGFAEYFTDKIFLPDAMQLSNLRENHYTLGDFHLGELTEQAKANTESTNANIQTWKNWGYYTRCPMSYENTGVMLESFDGGCLAYGSYGIRPAFYLSNASFSGEGTEENPYIISNETNADTDVLDVTYGDEFELTAEVSAEISLQSVSEDTVEFFVVNEETETSLGTAEVVYTNENKISGKATLTLTAGKDKFKIGENKIKAVYGGSINLNGSESDNITVNVIQKELQYTVAAEDKWYDGGNSVNITITPTNIINGDDVSATGIGVLESTEIGTYTKLTVSGVALSGEDTEYYSITEKEVECTVMIKGKDIAGEDVIMDTIPDYTFTGSPIEPEITLTQTGYTLVKGNDYEVEYSNNIMSGTATVTITGKGIYTGTRTEHFTINKLNSVITLSASYGESINLLAKVTTTELSDIDIVSFYSGNKLIGISEVKDGVATLMVTTDKDNFSIGDNVIIAKYNNGTVVLNNSSNNEITLNLKPRNISLTTISDIADSEYTGMEITPEIIVNDGEVILTSDDYAVSYDNNESVGTATVTITGKNYYTGTQIATFDITGENVDVLGELSNIFTITQTSNKLIVKQNAQSDVPEIKMYAAIYDEKGYLTDISIVEGAIENNVISFELLDGNDIKYMLWTDELQPIVNTIN